jgi:hypothetical protein
MLCRWLFPRLHTRHVHAIREISWYSRANPTASFIGPSFILRANKMLVLSVGVLPSVCCIIPKRAQLFLQPTLILHEAHTLTYEIGLSSRCVHLAQKSFMVSTLTMSSPQAQQLNAHTRVLYTWTKGRKKETYDYELWMVKNLEVGGRKVGESTIRAFICKDIAKS